MTIAHAASYLLTVDTGWSADWAWGLPLIMLTVIFHVAGLGVISLRVVHGQAGHRLERRHPRTAFIAVVGATTLAATCLHGIEAGIWAFAYRRLGALAGFKTCMLYSLNAMTSYGHTNLELQERWHLMGALEALNGWLLFGLTAAFLFAVIQNVWGLDRKTEHR
jgi:hypothetical protein